jgi:hypothetical protein
MPGSSGQNPPARIRGLPANRPRSPGSPFLPDPGPHPNEGARAHAPGIHHGLGQTEYPHLHRC